MGVGVGMVGRGRVGRGVGEYGCRCVKLCG